MERNDQEVDIEKHGVERESIETSKARKGAELERIKPYILCILSNLCYAAFSVISKFTLDKGMSRYVLVAYGHAFATLTSALLALCLERRNKSKLSLPVCRNVFFLGLFGALLRTLFYAGIESTSSSFGAAMINVTPSLTFLLAIFFRMEKLVMKKHSSQAKIAGTLISFGGATIMTLYKGTNLISFHNNIVNHQVQHSKSKLLHDQGWIKGAMLLFFHCLSSAAYYILQAKTIEQFPAPMVLTSLISLVGTVLSTIATLLLERKASVWRLSWYITLLAPLFSGIVIFGVTVYMQVVALSKRGPVFVTAFSPLTTIMAAIMGLFILGETLHLGSVVGASLIIVGLYAILWGKERERHFKLLSHAAISDEIKPEK